MIVEYFQIKLKYQMAAQQVLELISNNHQIPKGCPTGAQEAPKGGQKVDF